MEVTVVIACHFKSKNELCETTIARLKTALQSAQKGDLVWVTGDVPFAPGGPTLGNLMKDWLAERNTESSILLGGVGTFSEARKACESASQKGLNIKIVSSLWHLFQAKPIWQRRAEENGVKISFIPVGHTGGWRTIAIYVALGIIVRLAIVFGLENVLEKRLTASQGSRRQGFTFDGCR